MALVRRHWKKMVFCLAVLIAAAAWLLLFDVNAQTTAQAQVTPAPSEETESTADTMAARETLDEQTYYDMEKLRSQLMLRNEDLAALGCTGAESRAILEELLGWYEANREKLLQTRRVCRTAGRAYGAAMRRVNMGPRDEALIAQLPQLLLAVGEAAKQQRELTESAIPAMEKKLNRDQCAHWSSIRDQRHMPGLYRYAPGLSAQQKQAVRSAVRTVAHRRMTAQTDEQRRAAGAAFATAEANALSASQRSTLAEVQTRMHRYLPEVLEASRNALPAPKLPEAAAPELDPARKEMMEKLMPEQQTPEPQEQQE